MGEKEPMQTKGWDCFTYGNIGGHFSDGEEHTWAFPSTKMPPLIEASTRQNFKKDAMKEFSVSVNFAVKFLKLLTTVSVACCSHTRSTQKKTKTWIV